MRILQMVKSALVHPESEPKEKRKPKSKGTENEKFCSPKTKELCDSVVKNAKATIDRSNELAGKMQNLIEHGF